MQTKKLFLASFALPLILTASTAFAVGDHGAKKSQECQIGLNRGIMKELNLTDDQKEQFKELRKEMKEERMKRKEQKLAQLNDLLLAKDFDEKKAESLIKQDIEQRMEERSERKMRELRKEYRMFSILTAEQKEQFVELQKEQLTDCADKKSRKKGDKH